MKYGCLVGLFFTTVSHAGIDVQANEQPLPVTVDRQAVAKIPANYRFVEPGTLTVAVSMLNSPPLALLASDNRSASAAIRISPACWRVAWGSN